MCSGEVSNGIFLLLAIVLPIVLAVGWPLWNVITQNRSIRRVRKGLELCIEHATTNEQLIESDRYFLRLLRRNALSQEQQEQIRELRNLCCDAKGYHPSQFSGYRQALYDADPAFADEQNFKILWTDAKKASRKAVSVESHVASGKPAAGTVRTTGYASGAAASFHADLDDDDSIALDMEEAIDDDIMFHGGNPFDWDTRSDYLDDPFGFGDDDGFGGDGDKW